MAMKQGSSAAILNDISGLEFERAHRTRAILGVAIGSVSLARDVPSSELSFRLSTF
jgi:hypothetical protein